MSLDYRLVHTGQHYDEKMSDIFFGELGIPAPDINLGVGSGSHAVQTANVMAKFEPVCEQERPDWVVVVGDVNSTMACTLVCSKMGIKVAHVEAGLRSFDRTMPEEINRIVTDSLADLLLTPSPDADENLHREGIPEAKIKLVGNVMIDALVANLDKARASRLMPELGLEARGFVYVTLHRPSNVDNAESLASHHGRAEAVWRPGCRWCFRCTRARARCASSSAFRSMATPDLKVLEPIGYHDSLNLTENARSGNHRFGRLAGRKHLFPDSLPHPAAQHGTAHHHHARQQSVDGLAAAQRGYRAIVARDRGGPGRCLPLWDGKPRNGDAADSRRRRVLTGSFGLVMVTVTDRAGRAPCGEDWALAKEVALKLLSLLPCERLGRV